MKLVNYNEIDLNNNGVIMKIIELNRPSCEIVSNAKEMESHTSISKMALAAALTYEINDALPDYELIDVLIKYGNNPDGIAPLLYAIKMKDEKAAELLLKHGASPNTRRTTDLHSECDRVLPLTALDYAAAYGSQKLINLLIDLGAEINPKSSMFNNSPPLIFAAAYDNHEAVRILIHRGAQIVSSLGESAILFAVRYNCPLSLQALIDLGGDVNYKSPLFEAAREGSKQCVEVLLKNGAQIKDRDFNGSTVLHHLCASPQMYPWGEKNKDKPAILFLLIKAGGDPNAKDSHSSTPLLHLLWQSNNISTELLKALLVAGADPNVKASHDIRTPLQLASLISDAQLRQQVEQLLKSFGAK